MVARRQFSGVAVETTTVALLTIGGGTVDITVNTGWPSAAGVPFSVAIDFDSVALVEKCLATIVGSTLTLTRAQDGTTAKQHAAGAKILHVLTAVDADEANELAALATTFGRSLVDDVNAAAGRTTLVLGSVDNTSDAGKPVSTATQTALDLKAPIASPTFTGTVGGITKSMVGLGSVDNTTDANKPVSTATQTALDLKAPIASPTFTGTVGGITAAMVGAPSGSGTSSGTNTGDNATNTQYSGLAASKENVSNKATSFGTVNDTLYPTVQAVKTYADGLVVGLLDDRGSYDASVNTFPAAGGSGTAGAVLKGDLWYISVAGTLGGSAVAIGDSVRALIDSPAQTASNWSALESNIGYVPANTTRAINTTAPITGGGDLSADRTIAISAATTGASGSMSAADKSKLDGVATNANNYVHPNHSGDVTSVADGAQTIAANAVTNAKSSQMATKTYKGRTTAGTGNAEDVAVATLKTDLVLVKGDVGLGSVDNTSDANKPVSTATQTALDLKAPIASPTFTGTVAGISKAMVGLGNADNTSDANKPVSTATQTALDLKANLASPTFTGTVAGITKSMVGLGNADNTSDANKPVSTATQTALDLKAVAARTISTTAPLAGGGDLSADRTLTIVAATTLVPGSMSAADKTKLDGVATGATAYVHPNHSGDVTSVGDGAQTIVANAVTNAKASQMATKTYKGRTSALTGNSEDVAVATLKTDLVLVKGDVGLGSVDNTSDAGKPVSTATQTALDLKANLAGPTFTGTVGGITKSMVGLGSVDNTSDAGKPVSTAQQTALDLKANLAGPTFTGVPAAPTASAGTNTTQVATTAFVLANEVGVANSGTPFLTYVGSGALSANSTGADNTAIGYRALLANTVADDNTAVGSEALTSANTGGSNVAVGRYSSQNTTSGASNVALGNRSLLHNSTGNQNVAIGGLALRNNGTTVAALGTITGGSGYTNGTYNGVTMTYTTGTAPIFYPVANIVVAGGAVTTVTLTSFGVRVDTTTILSASASDIGGTGSGFSVPVASTSANNFNTAVGHNAGYNARNGSGNVFLGYQSGYNETGSNKLYIANSNTATPLIGGDFSAGTLTFTAAGGSTFSGVVSGPTAAADTNTTQLATTAFVTTADGLKANLASPTFTGTVAGITKSMVGLGSVDNTSDAGKPVSTATQTALDLKSNIASPTFTGVPAAPTAPVGTETTQLATTAFVVNNIFTRLSVPAATTIPAGFGMYVPDTLTVNDTFFLTISNTALLEVG